MKDGHTFPPLISHRESEENQTSVSHTSANSSGLSDLTDLLCGRSSASLASPLFAKVASLLPNRLSPYIQPSKTRVNGLLSVWFRAKGWGLIAV